jgi:DNA-directed RNA polymerase specialized sigma subunit
MKKPSPASAYRAVVKSPIERSRIQAATLIACRSLVADIVRKTVARRDWEEGEQVGAIGVLVALEKFDPAGRVSWRALVRRYVKQEIARWREHLVEQAC